VVEQRKARARCQVHEGRKKKIGAKGSWQLEAGDRVRIETPGGGASAEMSLSTWCLVLRFALWFFVRIMRLPSAQEMCTITLDDREQNQSPKTKDQDQFSFHARNHRPDQHHQRQLRRQRCRHYQGY
jgi:hypothetical protein